MGSLAFYPFNMVLTRVNNLAFHGTGRKDVIRHPEFAERLRKAVHRHPDAPAGRGDQKWLRETLLAKEGIECSPESVSRWFHGTMLPVPETMAAIARVVGAELNWLSGGDRLTKFEAKADPIARIHSNLARYAALAIELAGGRIEPSSRSDFRISVNGKLVHIDVLSLSSSPASSAFVSSKAFDSDLMYIIINKDEDSLSSLFHIVPGGVLNSAAIQKGDVFIAHMKFDGENLVIGSLKFPALEDMEGLTSAAAQSMS